MMVTYLSRYISIIVNSNVFSIIGVASWLAPRCICFYHYILYNMFDLIKYTTAIAIGSIVGFIGGFQGIAGGFYISMLLLFTGLAKTQRMASGTTLLAIVFPLSIGAVYEYWKTGDVDTYNGLIIAFFYTIFAWLGAKVNVMVAEEYTVLSLATLLFVTSGYFFHRFYNIIHKNK